MQSRSLSRIACTSLLFALAGCATPGLFKFSKEEFPTAGPKNPVVRILGMWEPAEGMALNKSTRGFSAQILFFSQKSDLAAQVDGDVVIYLFDDQGTDEEQASPFLQYKYDAGAWKAHMGKGPLGATYAIFVPYTRPGFHEAKCSLRIRFTPKGGQPVYSDMVNVVLPGKAKAKSDTSPDAADEQVKENETEPEHEAFAEFRDKISKRQPPRARGVATSIPTAEAVEEQVRASQKIVPAAKLTASERRRLMREAAAQLTAEKDTGRIELAGYEEAETEVLPGDSSLEEEVTYEASPPDDASPAHAARRSQPVKRRILDDDE